MQTTTVYVGIDTDCDGRVTHVDVSTDEPLAIWEETAFRRTVWQAPLAGDGEETTAQCVLDFALSNALRFADPQQWAEGQELAQHFYERERGVLRRIEAYLILAGRDAYTGVVRCQGYGVTVKTPYGEHYLVPTPKGEYVYYEEDPAGEEWINRGVIADVGAQEQDVAAAFNSAIGGEVDPDGPAPATATDKLRATIANTLDVGRLLDRLLDAADTALTWAHRRDRTGSHDLAYRLVAKPLMAAYVFGLHPIQGTRAYRQARAARRRGDVASAARQTAGDVLCAALRAQGIRAWVDGDGGQTYVVATPFSDLTVQIVVSAGDEVSATHAQHEHTTGWSAWLYPADGEPTELYSGTGGDCAQDSVACARAIAAWRARQPAGPQR